MGDRTSDERRGDTDDDMDLDTPLPPGQQGLEDVAWWWIDDDMDLDTPLPPGQQGLEDVAWWWIAATADAADPTLDDQAAVAEDWLTAGLVALACVVVRAVTPGATYRALLTYLRATSLRDLTTEAAALVPEETAPFVHITLQDFTNQDVLAWIEETMNRRHARIDAV